ncbi:MAG: FAD-dependent oxidoreductase [Paludibacter sp.]|nr:FAD-dependent oxidoreductase [Paludibacter sp.]
MKTSFFLLTGLLVLLPSCVSLHRDVVVVGGSASGTAAGIQAARLGAKTLIIEETPWLGGMLTAAGVSAVDGNHKLPSGFFGEFRDSLISRYGSAQALQTGWVSNVLFEPRVGNEILQSIAAKEHKLGVWHSTTFNSIQKTKKGWKVQVQKDGRTQWITASVVIDATELGDVAKAAGVRYDIGMDARAVSGEDIAPEQDNDIIQDLTYVMILKDYGVDKTIAKPKGYDASLFFCTAKSPDCTQPKPGQAVWPADKMMTYGKLPNGRYMINWPIEGNDYFVNMLEMNALEREEAIRKAKHFSLCYLYYLQTRLGFSTFGLDDEQFPTDDHFPLIPYHRESRRIHGLVRFNVNHVSKPFDQHEALYRTGIAVGDYPIDHHHKRNPEWDKLPELHFYPVPSYNVPLGALIPKETDGLIVAEKSISVSNILNGSTRLQPVVLQIGQAAGALAATAIQQHKAIAEVSVRDIQNILLERGVYLLPYLDVPREHPHFKALQRIGSTGILKGEGRNVGWSNETWFNAEKPVETSALKKDLSDFESTFQWNFRGDQLTVEGSFQLIVKLSGHFNKPTLSAPEYQSMWQIAGLGIYQSERLITRGELAVMLDTIIQPFELKKVDIHGNFLN